MENVERGAESGERQDADSRLPGKVGCSVHSPGWNWVTGNFGPFCDDCFKELKAKVIEWAKYYRGDK